jgi:hypothetical protein
MDKFWILMHDNDRDIKYYSRKEAEESIVYHGGGGYIMEAVAYSPKPVVMDIVGGQNEVR